LSRRDLIMLGAGVGALAVLAGGALIVWLVIRALRPKEKEPEIKIDSTEE
jgi:hypothetical protein